MALYARERVYFKVDCSFLTTFDYSKEIYIVLTRPFVNRTVELNIEIFL